MKCSKCSTVGGPGKRGRHKNGHRWFICAKCVGHYVADKKMDEQAAEAARLDG